MAVFQILNFDVGKKLYMLSKLGEGGEGNLDSISSGESPLLLLNTYFLVSSLVDRVPI